MAEGNYVERAIGAFYRSSGGEHAEHPDIVHSSEETLEGRHYIVLRTREGKTVAVYRVNIQKAIHRMRRWPKAFRNEPQ